jgi:PTH1 family peptidyl-tRNA hydrolase
MTNAAVTNPNFQLIIGLGNPGTKYQLTKHNIGWLVLDRYLDRIKHAQNFKEKFKGKFVETGTGSDSKHYFLYPQTFMNLSGESIRPFCDFYKLPVSSLIVLHDELDLPLGEVQFKMGGGTGGHNGLKSMDQHLGTKEFARLRIGIGRPEYGDVADWVLSTWSNEQWPQVEKFIDYAAQSLQTLLEKGWSKTINQYNRKNCLKE